MVFTHTTFATADVPLVCLGILVHLNACVRLLSRLLPPFSSSAPLSLLLLINATGHRSQHFELGVTGLRDGVCCVQHAAILFPATRASWSWWWPWKWFERNREQPSQLATVGRDACPPRYRREKCGNVHPEREARDGSSPPRGVRSPISWRPPQVKVIKGNVNAQRQRGNSALCVGWGGSWWWALSIEDHLK